MILIVGGYGSGKREYAIAALGVQPAEIADGELNDLPVLINLEGLVRAHMDDVDALLPMLEKKKVITCCEVGSGVIPMDTHDRLWREAVGRLCILLAQRADKVIRISCGLAQVLKS